MAHFDVYISGEGIAEIHGHTLVPEPGQSVHEAVLDRLQAHAEERGGAVEASVHDGPDGARFVLRVFPDGSSHVVEPDAAPAQPAAPAAAPASATAVLAPSPAATAPASASAVATAVARARATAVARTDVPAWLTGRIVRINELAAAGLLDEAFEDATELRESLTGSMGAEHPHAVDARAVEAYLAHLRGDHREAVVLALAVARIRCRARDDRAPAEVARAAAAWQQLDDDRAVVAHGRELLHMWASLEREGLLPQGHAALVGQVRGQVEALAAYV